MIARRFSSRRMSIKGKSLPRVPGMIPWNPESVGLVDCYPCRGTERQADLPCARGSTAPGFGLMSNAQSSRENPMKKLRSATWYPGQILLPAPNAKWSRIVGSARLMDSWDYNFPSALVPTRGQGTYTSLISLVPLRKKAIGVLVPFLIVMDSPGIEMQEGAFRDLDALVFEVLLGDMWMAESHGRSPLERRRGR